MKATLLTCFVEYVSTVFLPYLICSQVSYQTVF